MGKNSAAHTVPVLWGRHLPSTELSQQTCLCVSMRQGLWERVLTRQSLPSTTNSIIIILHPSVLVCTGRRAGAQQNGVNGWVDCMSERWMYRRRQNLKASLFTVSTQVWGNGTFILAGEKYKLAKGFFWKKISNKIITNENLKCTWLLTCQLRFYKCIPQICVQIFKDVWSTSCKPTCKHEFKKDWINYGIKVK